MPNQSNYAETLLGVTRLVFGLLSGLIFGFGAGMIAVHLLLLLIIGELGRDGWGAAPAWLLFCLLGGIVGAVAGIVLAVTLLKSPFGYGFEWLDLLISITGSITAASILFILLSGYDIPLRLIPICAAAPPSGLLIRWGVRKFVLPKRVDLTLDE